MIPIEPTTISTLMVHTQYLNKDWHWGYSNWKYDRPIRIAIRLYRPQLTVPKGNSTPLGAFVLLLWFLCLFTKKASANEELAMLPNPNTIIPTVIAILARNSRRCKIYCFLASVRCCLRCNLNWRWSVLRLEWHPEQ